MVTATEMTKAIHELLKNLPPINEEDIAIVKKNESLSIVQKLLLKRKLRKIIDGQNKDI